MSTACPRYRIGERHLNFLCNMGFEATPNGK